MKKIIERLIIFFVGLPALLALIIFIPHHNHLALNLVLTIFSALGALEFRNMLAKKDLHISAPETAILGALIPMVWTLVVSFDVAIILAIAAVALGTLWIIASRVFTAKDKFDSCIGTIVAGFAVMMYPGFFMAWVIQMAALEQATMVILIFCLVVFLNDSLAWAAGMLFGKNNRGLVPASPNKSIAGFAGGLAFSVLSGLAAAAFIPDVFSSTVMPSIPAGALLGFFAGIAATLGDLGESVLKRSSGVSDSGSFVLGRGGALDCMDSVAMAAPVFYILYFFLFYT